MKKARKKFVLWLVAFVLTGPLAFAQSAPSAPSAPTFSAKFSLSAKVLSVPGLSQVAIASDAGGTFQLTKNASLREDSILVPADNLTAYLGGVEYNIPTFKALAQTSLPKNQFQFYLCAGLGVDRSTPSGSSETQQHIAGYGGGGLNYDPTGQSHFTVNLFELRWARLPGVANNTALFSSGLSISF